MRQIKATADASCEALNGKHHPEHRHVDHDQTSHIRYLSLALLTLCVATFLVLHLFSPIVPFAATGDRQALSDAASFLINFEVLSIALAAPHIFC